MKLSTIAIAFTFSVISAQSFAQNVRFNPINENVETQACYTAATEGYEAAKRLIRENGFFEQSFAASLRCNDVSLRTFAELYSNNEVTKSAKTIALVAKNEDVASQACVDALSIGKEEALAKYGLEGETIICNRKEIADFVRTYRSESVVIRSASE